MSSSWPAFTLIVIACILPQSSRAAETDALLRPPPDLTTHYCKRSFSIGDKTYALDQEKAYDSRGLLPFVGDLPGSTEAFRALEASHNWDQVWAGIGTLGLLVFLSSLFLPDSDSGRFSLQEGLFWGGIGGMGFSALTGITLSIHRKVIVNGLISAYNETHPEQTLTLGLRARFFFF